MENKPNQTIFVLYQDDARREPAMAFCDELVQRFWTECAFDITWCSFAELMRESKGAKAASQAARANMIVFAAAPETWVPAEIRSWSEAVAKQRSEREGSFLGLLDPSISGDGTANAYTWARNFAHRAGLDYLTQCPPTINSAVNSVSSCSARASAVTSVLDDILKHHPLPRPGVAPGATGD